MTWNRNRPLDSSYAIARRFIACSAQFIACGVLLCGALPGGTSEAADDSSAMGKGTIAPPGAVGSGSFLDDAPRPASVPCLCRSRGTLMQWSYGTSFSGGPDLNAPLVTDRPDFTEASSTVGRGVAQIELGYTYAFDDDGTTATNSHSYPETLLRYGVLADWFELRTAWNYGHEVSSGVDDSGSEDLYVGAKIALTPQEGILPEMALIPQMTIPTGADSSEALPGVNWVYGWDLSDCLSTAGSTQVNRSMDDDSGDAYLEFAQSWTVGYSLTERLGAYTEWFALIPHSADFVKPEHYFNGGFTYLLTDDVQFDIRAGVGLNDAAEDYFVGTGLSIRFR